MPTPGCRPLVPDSLAFASRALIKLSAIDLRCAAAFGAAFAAAPAHSSALASAPPRSLNHGDLRIAGEGRRRRAGAAVGRAAGRDAERRHFSTRGGAVGALQPEPSVAAGGACSNQFVSRTQFDAADGGGDRRDRRRGRGRRRRGAARPAERAPVGGVDGAVGRRGQPAPRGGGQRLRPRADPRAAGVWRRRRAARRRRADGAARRRRQRQRARRRRADELAAARRARAPSSRSSTSTR